MLDINTFLQKHYMLEMQMYIAKEHDFLILRAQSHNILSDFGFKKEAGNTSYFNTTKS